MIEIDWDTYFDPAYGIINVEPSTYIYYRGYDSSYPIVSDRPAYFGSLRTANGYGSIPGRRVNAFTNGNPLRLIDVRFMKDILRNLFDLHHPEEETSIYSVLLSFGICSLNHQIGLAAERFPSLKGKPPLINLKKAYKESKYEQQGVRIAETENDAVSMGFLKTLFEGFVDGFISPRQKSPFHVEKPDTILNAEMIIFNPIKCDMKIVDPVPTKILKTSVDLFYNRELGKKIHVGSHHIDTSIYLKTGGGVDTELPTVEQINMNFDKPEIMEAWNKGTRAGSLWKEKARFGELINPHPTYPVTAWNDTKPKRKSFKRKL
jgi:hypothetical protein